MKATELREEIGRVLDSGALHQSAVLRRILEYLGEAAEQGKGDVKEYTIGVEALGKSSAYDPQRDSTVRVQVGKLRQKLDEYYREQGAAHRMRISLPKGTFRLQLESKPHRVQAGEQRVPFLWIGVAALAVLVIAFASYSLGLRRAARTNPASASGTSTPDLSLFWQPIVGNGMPIVVSYDLAMTIEVPPWKFRDPDINDPEELAASPAWRELSNRLGHPAFRTDYPYVGFGVAHGTFLLSQLLAAQRSTTLLKRSTVLSWEDLAHSHLVFIGTGKTAKIRYILQNGDFQWDRNKVTNLKPQPGEAAEFPADIDSHSGEYRRQYGVISMLPGFDPNTRVLILGGGISEADWAVVKYVTSPDHVAELVRRLKTKSGDLPKAFQVLVRIQYESRVPVSIDYVTHHVLSVPGELRREGETK
jgi:hypothetical protein